MSSIECELDPVAMSHRPMSNCLRPITGAGSYHNSLPQGRDVTLGVLHYACNPMPDQVGCCIETSNGYCKLFVDELAKGLGLPSDRLINANRLPARFVNNLVGFHLWEALTAGLDRLRPPPVPETNIAASISDQPHCPDNVSSGVASNAVIPDHLVSQFECSNSRQCVLWCRI